MLFVVTWSVGGVDSMRIIASMTLLIGCGAGTKQPTSAQIVAAFQSAGLETGTARPMTPADYGAAPLLAQEGTRFFIGSLGADTGGRVLTFANQTDLTKVQQYYVTLGQKSALFFSWIYVRGNALVQINGTLPQAKAEQYQSVLNGMH